MDYDTGYNKTVQSNYCEGRSTILENHRREPVEVVRGLNVARSVLYTKKPHAFFDYKVCRFYRRLCYTVPGIYFKVIVDLIITW